MDKFEKFPFGKVEHYKGFISSLGFLFYFVPFTTKKWKSFFPSWMLRLFGIISSTICRMEFVYFAWRVDRHGLWFFGPCIWNLGLCNMQIANLYWNRMLCCSLFICATFYLMIDLVCHRQIHDDGFWFNFLFDAKKMIFRFRGIKSGNGFIMNSEKEFLLACPPGISPTISHNRIEIKWMGFASMYFVDGNSWIVYI